jgi:hypothetical protein
VNDRFVRNCVAPETASCRGERDIGHLESTVTEQTVLPWPLRNTCFASSSYAGAPLSRSVARLLSRRARQIEPTPVCWNFTGRKPQIQPPEGGCARHRIPPCRLTSYNARPSPAIKYSTPDAHFLQRRRTARARRPSGIGHVFKEEPRCPSEYSSRYGTPRAQDAMTALDRESGQGRAGQSSLCPAECTANAGPSAAEGMGLRDATGRPQPFYRRRTAITLAGSKI